MSRFTLSVVVIMLANFGQPGKGEPTDHPSFDAEELAFFENEVIGPPAFESDPESPTAGEPGPRSARSHR